MGGNATQISRSRRMLVVGGYGVLAAVFVGAGLAPQWHHESAVKAEIEASKAQIADHEQTREELATIQHEIEIITQQTQDYDRLVPSNQDLGGFLGQLSQELDKAGMKDITVKNLTPNTLNHCVQLPIQIHGTGTYAQFHSFLTKLESFHRKSSVSKLTIDSADPSMSGQVTVDLTLSIYNTKQSG